MRDAHALPHNMLCHMKLYATLVATLHDMLFYHTCILYIIRAVFYTLNLYLYHLLKY
jgi:hypothetical protein